MAGSTVESVKIAELGSISVPAIGTAGRTAFTLRMIERYRSAGRGRTAEELRAFFEGEIMRHLAHRCCSVCVIYDAIESEVEAALVARLLGVRGSDHIVGVFNGTKLSLQGDRGELFIARYEVELHAAWRAVEAFVVALRDEE